MDGTTRRVLFAVAAVFSLAFFVNFFPCARPPLYQLEVLYVLSP
jgi:hypothetical protein